MPKYILNGISHFDFFEKLEKHFSEINLQLEKDESDVVIYRKRVDDLIYEVESVIRQSISPNSEYIIELLDNSYSNFLNRDYSFYGSEKGLDFKKEVERLNRFRKSLRLAIGYLSMTVTLFDPNAQLIATNISEKNDFLLSKLNSVFGDEMFSIEQIFNLNNIKYRDDETREIAVDLSKRGYLILQDSYRGDKVKISVKGARFIERKIKTSQTSKKGNELNQKIDTILEHLVNLGFGQEIIFNEIDELRSLQDKLSKKSWSQLLKGKLVDLAVDKLITVDIAKSVYEYLTNSNFKLLK